MLIKGIELHNFRNYSYGEIEFDPGVNLFLGMNAQGKTNLLEAVYFLLKGVSFRTRSAREMIRTGSDYFYLKGNAGIKDIVHFLEASINSSHEKMWKADGKNDYSELDYPVVIFTPEDLSLIKGSPSLRRRYIDQCVIDLFPYFKSIFKNYNRSLQQRNDLLKRAHSFSRYTLELQLEPWEKEMAKLAAAITLQRKKVVEMLSPFVTSLYWQISNGEEISLLFVSQINVNLGERETEQEWFNLFSSRKEEEIKKGITLFGPQRDELEIMINGVSSRLYSSQGQQRTAALALKIALIPLIKSEKNDTPLLILDDVFSELDQARVNAMINQLLKEGQTLITSSSAPVLDNLNPAVFQINAGRVVPYGKYNRIN